MARNKLLLEKDRVQKKLWEESGRTVQGYLALIEKYSQKMRRSGIKIRYV